MYDRETETLWSQLLGEAVEGPLAGVKLEFLPSIMTTWTNWREMHPDTIALEKGYFGDRDPYRSYYKSDSAGVLGFTNRDTRLGTKEFVIGVEVDREVVAYPFSVLSGEPVVNDEIAGVPVVVAFDADNATGVVWERTLADGRVLEFLEVDGDMMLDRETGSLWDGLSGRAIEGELVGESLTQVPSKQSFWFGWVDFHEDTKVYGIDES